MKQDKGCNFLIFYAEVQVAGGAEEGAAPTAPALRCRSSGAEHMYVKNLMTSSL